MARLPAASRAAAAGTNVPQISGETFLRGYLRTDGTGSAEIRTIYPGWYTGRTPHIHIKVWLGDQALTSQMYMPDAVTNAVYGRPPYAARPGRDIATNESDGIYQQTSGRTILSLIPAGSGMIGRLTLAVVPGAAGLGQTAVVGGGPGGMGGPPPVTPDSSPGLPPPRYSIHDQGVVECCTARSPPPAPPRRCRRRRAHRRLRGAASRARLRPVALPLPRPPAPR